MVEEARQGVLRCQEDRTKTYADFEEGYRVYLDGGDEKEYAQLCNQVTQKFAASSNAIRGHEEELKALGATKLCEWVRKIQDGEQAHLNLTIALQVERKRAHMFKQQRETRLNDGHGHGHSHGHGHGSCQDETLDEEEDFMIDVQDSKLSWIKEQVRDILAEINEAIDEIRYWEQE